MGIRETLNKNPSIAIVGTILIIVGAIGVIVWQLMPPSLPKPPTLYYYTEDGTTLFADTIFRVAPFTGPGGKPAYRARVFQCNKEEPKVVFLQKFDAASKKQLDEWYAKEANKGRMAPNQMEYEDSALVAKPPQSGQPIDKIQWASGVTDKGSSIQSPPPCASGQLREVFPTKK